MPDKAYKNHDDENHPRNKLRVEFYCSPKYAMEVKEHKYKVAFMLRVRPDKIRYSKSKRDFWVVNGDFSELRP